MCFFAVSEVGHSNSPVHHRMSKRVSDVCDTSPLRPDAWSGTYFYLIDRGLKSSLGVPRQHLIAPLGEGREVGCT